MVKLKEGPVVCKINKIKMQGLKVKVRGISPLLTNNPSEVSEELIREAEGKRIGKSKTRDLDLEFIKALHSVNGYVDPSSKIATQGKYGFRGQGFKEAMVNAARFLNDKAVSMTKCKALIRVVEEVVPVKCKKLSRFVTHPKNSKGQMMTTIVGRFDEWEAEFTLRYDPTQIAPDTLLSLLKLAGAHVGLGVWRVGNGGMFGEFEVV